MRIPPRSGRFYPRLRARILKDDVSTFDPGYEATLKSQDFCVNIKTNSLGFRERELFEPDGSLQSPVLFIGDCIFMGYGVEEQDRVTNRLADIARERGISRPVINLSFIGWRTNNYFSCLTNFYERLRPQNVVVGIYIGFEFGAVPRPARSREEVKKPGGFKKVLRDLLRLSPLLNLSMRGLWASQSFRAHFNKKELMNERVDIYLKDQTQKQKELYDNTTAYLSMMADYAKDKGVDFLVVLIPDHLQVLEKDIFTGLDREKPQRILNRHCADNGIKCLDLLAAFENHPRPASLYFDMDKHWSCAAHRFAADVLADEIFSDYRNERSKPSSVQPAG
ncbi:MAG TPA: hypothetical protein ENI68_03565 [Gammaproteobacteria bacterium]|nr:hypothetical protein [Gammaproteobacteria bacterium]